MEIVCKDFRRDVQNTRKGYFTLSLAGVEIRKCVLHKHPGGSIWFSPPAVQVDHGGKSGWEAVVAVPDESLKQLIRDAVTAQLGAAVKND